MSATCSSPLLHGIIFRISNVLLTCPSISRRSEADKLPLAIDILSASSSVSASKVCLAERASISAIDGFRESNRVVGHAHAVTGSHRISSFNGRYAGADKSFNKSFLFLEQQTVLNCKRGLTCDDRKKPFILFVEVRKRRGGVRVKRCFVLRKFVQELYNPDQVSAWRDQRAGEK